MRDVEEKKNEEVSLRILFPRFKCDWIFMFVFGYTRLVEILVMTGESQVYHLSFMFW